MRLSLLRLRAPKALQYLGVLHIATDSEHLNRLLSDGISATGAGAPHVAALLKWMIGTRSELQFDAACSRHNRRINDQLAQLDKAATPQEQLDVILSGIGTYAEFFGEKISNEMKQAHFERPGHYIAQIGGVDKTGVATNGCKGRVDAQKKN